MTIFVIGLAAVQAATSPMSGEDQAALDAAMARLDQLRAELERAADDPGEAAAAWTRLIAESARIESGYRVLNEVNLAAGLGAGLERLQARINNADEDADAAYSLHVEFRHSAGDDLDEPSTLRCEGGTHSLSEGEDHGRHLRRQVCEFSGYDDGYGYSYMVRLDAAGDDWFDEATLSFGLSASSAEFRDALAADASGIIAVIEASLIHEEGEEPDPRP